MIECPVEDCHAQVKSYRYLGHHTRPKHGICSDCALNRKTVCRCQEKRIAEQADRGEIVRVRLAPQARGRREIQGEIQGDPAKDTFITIAENERYELHLIHSTLVREVTPMAFNLITAEWEADLLGKTIRYNA